MRFFLVIFCVILFTACHKYDIPAPAPGADSIAIAGKKYPIVKVGNQYWTATNYDGPGGKSYDASNSKPEYGKYYSYEEIKTINVPDGWHIPTRQDYITLAKANDIILSKDEARSLNIKSLTAKSHWKNIPGTNASGFNAFPGGYMFFEAQPLDGEIAEYWTVEGYTFSMQELNMTMLRILLYNNSSEAAYRFNLRFVKN